MAKWKFDCPAKGHKPMDGIPEDKFVFGGKLHIGRVCRKCKSPYFEQVSDEVLNVSKLLSPDGQAIISAEADES